MSGVPELTVDDVVKLMKYMQRHRIAVMEYGGCKLALAPAERPHPSAVSTMNVPAGAPPPGIMVGGSAQERAVARITEMQERAERARKRAVSRHDPVARAVEGVYQEAKKEMTKQLSVPPEVAATPISLR